MGDTRGWFDDDALWKTITPHMFSEKILAMAAELTASLRDCGFNQVRVYDDLAGAPYDHEAKRLIVVAQK